MKRFKLHIAKTDQWVWVMVYDTLEEMRAAAASHDDKSGVVQAQKGGGADGFHSRALGITHRYTRTKYDKDGGKLLLGDIGTIRLTTGYLQTRIVSHELVHAVLWAYRLKFNHGNMGRNWAPLWREEYYAHMYGDTFNALMKLMYKKGFWH